jgi:hypothetical protein
MPLSKDKIDRLIADMIILDTQPYTVVEDRGFTKLISAAFPHYKLLSRTYFTNYISKLYDEKLIILHKELQNVQNISITTDLWTSINQESRSGSRDQIVVYFL